MQRSLFMLDTCWAKILSTNDVKHFVNRGCSTAFGCSTRSEAGLVADENVAGGSNMFQHVPTDMVGFLIRATANDLWIPPTAIVGDTYFW